MAKIKVKKESRRKFIGDLGKASLATGMMTTTTNITTTELKKTFIHHVFFWLKNSDSAEDKTKLIQGLRKLSKVQTIQQFHIGIPADTRREVIDSSYSVSWFVLFKNGKDQASYQTDPIHLKFVDECAQLWEKVVVHDTVDA